MQKLETKNDVVIITPTDETLQQYIEQHGREYVGYFRVYDQRDVELLGWEKPGVHIISGPGCWQIVMCDDKPGRGYRIVDIIGPDKPKYKDLQKWLAAKLHEAAGANLQGVGWL